MKLSMSQSLSQRQTMTQRISISMPQTNWSLVDAFDEDHAREFDYPLTIKRRKLPSYGQLSHEEQMRLVEQLNTVFRFVYTRGENIYTGRAHGYYRIPLLRDRNVMADLDSIKQKITKAEYERSQAILECVGRMERIARAVPYHSLLTTVRQHLKKQYRVKLDQVVIVGVDRGGRLPAVILGRALNCTDVHFLKVDQGGGQLDIDRLEEFVANKTLRKKHALFVDSTVDSGRQIRVLERYFDDSAWQQKLGHISWCVVGSNEYGDNLKHHLNINWGVDPDTTFEDDPRLMGVDYAPGSHVKVVDVPSETSEKIRQLLLDVPAGIVFDLDDIDEQIAEQKARIAAEAAAEKALADAAREAEKITATRRWSSHQALLSGVYQDVPQAITNGHPSKLHNILVVGNGRKVDLSAGVINFVVDTLGRHHSLFAGTPDGNPGAVLKATLERIAQPEVRLYQPLKKKGAIDDSFGGTPVDFSGIDKTHMRQRMIQASDVVVALGGGSGTLREVLLALAFNKPTVVLADWGPIAPCLMSRRKYQAHSCFYPCKGITHLVQTVVDLTIADADA